MPAAGVTHDVVLKTIDGATKVGIALHRGSTAVPGGYSRADVKLQQRQSNEQASYDAFDPENDLVYEQTSFHRGLGQSTVVRRGDDDFRYACGDGTLMHFNGSIVSGYLEDEVDLILQNPRFESDDGAATGWGDGSNATVAASTDARTGEGAITVTITTGPGYAAQDYGGTVAALQSREITFSAYVKRVSGSGTLTPRINGDVSGDTDGSATSETDWTPITVTKTIGGSDATVSFRLVGSVTSDVWRVDDAAVSLTGDAEFNDSAAELGGELYVTYGRAVLKWNETNDAFYPVYVDAAYSVQCIRELNGKLYIGFGSNQTYKHSSDGSTWTAASNAAGTLGDADFFAVVRNANGDLALMKVASNQVALNSTDPTDCNNWGADIEVGSSDKAVNNVLEGNDTAYVGKTEGLMAYERSQQRFRNLAPEAVRFTAATNFKAAVSRGSQIYTALGGQSLWAMQDNGDSRATGWTELSHLVKSHVYEGFSGEVQAIADDLTSMWIALADSVERGFPYTFPITFGGGTGGINSSVRVLILRRADEKDDPRGGQLVSHTVTTVSMSNVHELARFGDSLFIMGNFVNSTTGFTEPRVVRLRLPADNENPMRSSSPKVRKTTIFCGQYIDYFYPDVEKALAKITVKARNLSADRYVEVGVKRDDDGPEDDTGWEVLGNITDADGGSVQASLTTPYTFDRIRVRLRLITNDSSQPIEVTGYVIHSVLNFKKSDEWVIETVRRDTRRRRRGLKARRQAGLSKTQRTTLETLAAEPFLYLEDVDGSTPVVRIDDIDDDYTARKSRANESAAPDKVFTTTIRMHEVRRST